MSTVTINIDDPDFVDEERGGYGAYLEFEVSPVFGTVLNADTPLGPDIRETVTGYNFVDGMMFVSDQDGGELYGAELCEDDLLDYLNEDEILEKLIG